MAARRLCCLVVAEGPDATGAVAAAVSFHGTGAAGPSSPRRVALSCSGVALGAAAAADGGRGLVAAPLSLVSPFLRAQAGAAGGGGHRIPAGVSLRVLLPAPDAGDDGDGSGGRWEDARVAGVARLPSRASAALRTALSRLRNAEEPAAASSGGGGPIWRLGWALARPAAAAKGGGWGAAEEEEAESDEAATFLVLSVKRGRSDPARPPALCRCDSALLPPASPVVAWGAPFGALAPGHFAGSAVAGVVSGPLGPSSSSCASTAQSPAAAAAVVRLDVAALPGMEGGPVACARCGGLAAVLSRPLARRGGGGGRGGGSGGAAGAVEVPLAFPAALLLDACSGFLPLGSMEDGAAATSAAASDDAVAATTTTPTTSPAAGALGRPLASGVVMVRRGGSAWATGVVLPGRGAAAGRVLVLTIAHLFDAPPRQQQQQRQQQHGGDQEVRVRVTCLATGRQAWSAPAALLHRFRSPQLDLAVLSVPCPSDSAAASAVLRSGLGALAPLELLPPPPPPPPPLSPSPPAAAPLPVVVAGHGLFGPALGWPAAATAGSLARVVSSGSAPMMALTTAAVHAGASGAAVLCARTGRLAAVATSNSRHVPPAGAVGAATTLPRWNYAVPADALRPLWRWAEEEDEARRRRRQRWHPSDDDAARAALRGIDERAMLRGGEAAARVWALLPPAVEEQSAAGTRRRSKL
jgi:hypothetical protein